jgi:2,4-dienoyl-CoA reductase-like NADH-dependent reductase (Old Yellow Enzyme family)
MSTLFSPLRLAGIELPNRIVVSPMCQHMAVRGVPTEWHLIHWGQMALSGAAMILSESTAVSPEGRITPNCLGIWSDAAADAIGRMAAICRRYAPVRFGLQLSHAGRKGAHRPAHRGYAPETTDAAPWPLHAASALPFADNAASPAELDAAGLARIREAFRAAAIRARDADVDALELHMAHGYLLHGFLSPLTNTRGDAYGGSPAARMRYPLEVFATIREVWPAERPLGVRISATDWIAGGLVLEDQVALVKRLRDAGCDFCDVSSGGIAPTSRPPQVTEAYQLPFAAEIRRATGIATCAVGMILQPRQAEAIVAEGTADMVCLGRAMLDDPRWPWRAAQALGVKLTYPPPLARAHPDAWPGAGLLRPG